MTLDWNAFTPGSALLGGLLIGLAACILILANGRIAGISGILGGLLARPSGDKAWRAAILDGMHVAPWLAALAGAPVHSRIDADNAWVLIAGLLVGLGTRYGSGCTSGHGVCGLSRFSVRSLAATLCFMGAAFATVFVTRHLLT